MQEHKKNTLTPVWNERKWLMVQEPKTQPLRVEVYDWDRINAKELLTINLLKGLRDTMGAKTLMGRYGKACCALKTCNGHTQGKLLSMFALMQNVY